jgi:hypothetical protein
MDLLEEAVESRGPYVTRGYLKTDPVFRSLDGNPRFERLKVGGIDAPKN